MTYAAAELLRTSTRRTLRLDFHDGDQVTTEVPGVPPEALAHLDDDGLARVGATVSPGMILIGRLAVARRAQQDAAGLAVMHSTGESPFRSKHEA